jgi:NADPH2:quinone reductase
MRAIRVHAFGGPEVLRLEEVADPEPGPGQVRVRLAAAGVSPADVEVRAGTFLRLPALPYIPGSAGAGTVEALGEGVRGLAPGDRVWLSGASTYAEACVVAATRIHPLPGRLSFAQGAAIGGSYATAYQAIHLVAGVRPGDLVLVHGASGAVGTAALQLLAAHGAIAVGTAATDAGRAHIIGQGAAAALAHDAWEDLLAATGGRGYDAILEMRAEAGENVLRDGALLAPRGSIVLIGAHAPARFNPLDLMVRGAAIRGMATFLLAPEAQARVEGAIATGLADGRLNPVVGQSFPLAEAAAAHAAVWSGAKAGKVVLLTA